MFTRVQDIKKGDKVVEFFGGIKSPTYVADHDAQRVENGEQGENGWVVHATAADGEKVRWYVHHEITAYGPHLAKIENE